MDTKKNVTEPLKPVPKEPKTKKQFPTKSDLLRLASSQELINCYTIMERAAREGQKSCYLLKECDYSLSRTTIDNLLDAGIDLSQDCIMLENVTIPNILYSVRAYFDDMACGIKRTWKEPTKKC